MPSEISLDICLFYLQQSVSVFNVTLQESRRAYVIPAKVELLHKCYWDMGKVIFNVEKCSNYFYKVRNWI